MYYSKKQRAECLIWHGCDPEDLEPSVLDYLPGGYEALAPARYHNDEPTAFFVANAISAAARFFIWDGGKKEIAYADLSEEAKGAFQYRKEVNARREDEPLCPDWRKEAPGVYRQQDGKLVGADGALIRLTSDFDLIWTDEGRRLSFSLIEKIDGIPQNPFLRVRADKTVEEDGIILPAFFDEIGIDVEEDDQIPAAVDKIERAVWASMLKYDENILASENKKMARIAAALINAKKARDE